MRPGRWTAGATFAAALAAFLAGVSATACGPSTLNPPPGQASLGGSSGAATSGSGVSGATGSGATGSGAGSTGATGSGSGSTGAAGDASGDASAGMDSGTDAPSAPEASAEDTGAGDAAQETGSSGDGAAPAPPLCAPGIAWADGTSLAISTGADQFGAVTPDERTLVWTTTATGGIATIVYADRTDPTVPFANPVSLVLSSIDVIAGPMAISPDGLRLALEAADTTFFTVTRPDRSSPFGPTVDTTEFAELNGEIAASEAVVQLGDPVYGADGQTFFYSRFPVGGAQGIATIFEAAREGIDPWNDGTPLNGDAIQETDGEVRRRPSGISADALTLFYWDDAAAGEMMAWRTTADGAFANPSAIGAKAGAQPNATCTTLYYSAPADGGTALFAASRQ
ncbi:MAG TPA: hypothetical protein VK841_21805 [Polyangiaceae bacterium]|jgi:hypothetical protein|nr:hypothetical protein [Polyangiaceae bacterium]